MTAWLTRTPVPGGDNVGSSAPKPRLPGGYRVGGGGGQLHSLGTSGARSAVCTCDVACVTVTKPGAATPSEHTSWGGPCRCPPTPDITAVQPRFCHRPGDKATGLLPKQARAAGVFPTEPVSVFPSVPEGPPRQDTHLPPLRARLIWMIPFRSQKSTIIRES